MSEGGIYKLDRSDGSVLGKCTPPAAQYNGYGGLTYDGTYLWEADSYGGGIYKLSRSDCSIISTIPSPGGCRRPGDLAWDGSYLWLYGGDTKLIYKIRPDTGAIVLTFHHPEGGVGHAGLTYDGEYLWVSGTNTIYKLDSAGTVISSFPVACSRPESLAFDGEYLWCASFDGGMIYRIDIGITPTPSTPSAPQNLQATAGEGYVYLDWDTPSDDGGSTITEYKIYRGTGTAWTYLASTRRSWVYSPILHDMISVPPETSYNDTGFASYTTYYYKVSAVNSAGEGALSNEASATPTPEATMPWLIPTLAIIVLVIVVIAVILIYRTKGRKV
jgi:DNA-binding beta-propeller fold protein YncE